MNGPKPSFAYVIEETEEGWVWVAKACDGALLQRGVARSRRHAAALVIRALVRHQAGDAQSAPSPAQAA